jgi:hypothetical protein
LSVSSWPILPFNSLTKTLFISIENNAPEPFYIAKHPESKQ